MCPSCTKSVGEDVNAIRYGKTSKGMQRFKCLSCGRTFLRKYSNEACRANTDKKLAQLLREGCGIRSMGRILRISPTTVQSRIQRIAARAIKPAVPFGKEYEVDEMCTYIGRKSRQYWIAYAIRRDTKEVVDFRIGKRTNKTLKGLIHTLHLSEARKIFTDKLPNYRFIVDGLVHDTRRGGTNHIERKNLTLRTHLKRLHRRTICFSRSFAMLQACLQIYFGGAHTNKTARVFKWQVVIDSESSSPTPSSQGLV